MHTLKNQFSRDLPSSWQPRALPGKSSVVWGVTLSRVLEALIASADRAPPSPPSGPPISPPGPRTARLPSRPRAHLGSCGLAHTWEPRTMVIPHPTYSSVSELGSGRTKPWPSPPYSADLLPENLKESEPHSVTSSCLKPDVSLEMLCG